MLTKPIFLLLALFVFTPKKCIGVETFLFKKQRKRTTEIQILSGRNIRGNVMKVTNDILFLDNYKPRKAYKIFGTNQETQVLAIPVNQIAIIRQNKLGTRLRRFITPVIIFSIIGLLVGIITVPIYQFLLGLSTSTLISLGAISGILSGIPYGVLNLWFDKLNKRQRKTEINGEKNRFDKSQIIED